MTTLTNLYDLECLLKAHTGRREVQATARMVRWLDVNVLKWLPSGDCIGTLDLEAIRPRYYTTA